MNVAITDSRRCVTNLWSPLREFCLHVSWVWESYYFKKQKKKLGRVLQIPRYLHKVSAHARVPHEQP